MARRRLPLGIQTFRELRELECYYVDKTTYVKRLLDKGKYYFLSRPRRFGKSLFLDTLKELFEGSEELFAGLYIHERWTWSARHPVVRLSFGGRHFASSGDLDANLAAQLDDIEVEAGLNPRYETAPERFGYLIRTLHRQTGRRVVVLVDEYDKPILDALEDREVARANRDFLRGLYGVIKDSDAHVRFAFLTGISKFSKVNRPRHFRGSFLDGRTGWAGGEAGGADDGALFSQLNNLTDITLDPRYSSICGYTEHDLDTVFGPELAGLDREQVREWYNGYSWLGAEQVYNPYDVLLLFDRHKYAAHWFETGTPAFLVDLLLERRVASVSLDRMVSTEEMLSTFDVEQIGTEALLFQTGYLTITGEEELGGKALYRLRLSQPGGTPEPERIPAAATGAGRGAADREQHALGAPAGGERLRGVEGVVPRLLRQHPIPVVHEQPDRRLRRLLRKRGLLLLRGVGVRDHGGGVEQPRAAGHGGARVRSRVPVRVQGGGDGAAGIGAGAAQGTAVRGQVPGAGRTDPSGRGGVQP